MTYQPAAMSTDPDTDSNDWKSMVAVVRALSGVWVPAVLAALRPGALRFSELAERVAAAGPDLGAPTEDRTLHRNTLAQTLKGMQLAGLLERSEQVRTVPKVVTYELTDEAHRLIKLMRSVRDWPGRS